MVRPSKLQARHGKEQPPKPVNTPQMAINYGMLYDGTVTKAIQVVQNEVQDDNATNMRFGKSSRVEASTFYSTKRFENSKYIPTFGVQSARGDGVFINLVTRNMAINV
ncbi:conserved hypothetical protein [Ricinus communis]|uniref:Uncharacterized protein n=1 Tax=Ricinus communis TaxID=3988 RepID=B9RPX8_RICCO|nr:conserved hypothetical protein [Ricinus communis]